MTSEEGRWSLRRASVDDAPAIARFHAACWKDAYLGIVPDEVLARIEPDEWSTRWVRRLTQGRRTTAVAELAGPSRRVVGIATWGPSHDAPEPGLPTLELASLYVGRELWGSGLAAALLDYAVGDARLHLWVFEANMRGRAFYEKHGFVPDGSKVDDITGVTECRYVRGERNTGISPVL